jgi:hypothetical protein
MQDEAAYGPRDFSSAYYDEEYTDFTKWRFAIKEQLEELEHDLIGEVKVKNPDGEEIWCRLEGFSPMMTRESAREFISLCKIIVSKVTFLSDLTLNEILKIMRDIDVEMTDMLFDNWDKWDIDKSRLGMIHIKITRFIFIALKQAQNAKTLESLTKIEQIRRVFDETKKKDEGVKLSPFPRRGD